MWWWILVLVLVRFILYNSGSWTIPVKNGLLRLRAEFVFTESACKMWFHPSAWTQFCPHRGDMQSATRHQWPLSLPRAPPQEQEPEPLHQHNVNTMSNASTRHSKTPKRTHWHHIPCSMLVSPQPLSQKWVSASGNNHTSTRLHQQL